MRTKVYVSKIDLDTCGAAHLLSLRRADEVIVVRGEAPPEALADPEVICIECGGSGEPQLNNWDHHKLGGPIDSATKQVWEHLLRDGVEVPKIVEYIDIMDTKGPSGLPSSTTGFPTLSDCFAGMLLTERDPVEQLHRGVELLEKIVAEGQDPFGTIKGFDSYAGAKAEYNRLSANAVEGARWGTTAQGKKVAHVGSSFYGALGALYGKGADVVVALNPDFNGVRKFTIGGNGVRVDTILPALNALEPGWGGPASGTILGSPRDGSNLTLKQVVDIVKTGL